MYRIAGTLLYIPHSTHILSSLRCLLAKNIDATKEAFIFW